MGDFYQGAFFSFFWGDFFSIYLPSVAKRCILALLLLACRNGIGFLIADDRPVLQRQVDQQIFVRQSHVGGSSTFLFRHYTDVTFGRLAVSDSELGVDVIDFDECYCYLFTVLYCSLVLHAGPF